MQADGTVRLFQYSQAGQYLFGSKQTTAGVQTTQENIYLAGSLIATVDHNWPSNTVIATTYHHTDALGSPVATTNTAGALIERTNYEPYGSAINKTVDGIGYTGHVMDGATGLTYMQQRYYDPTLGRFLSVDPVTANSGTGDNFNRYWYANNNPYTFTDPDGRKPKDRGASYVGDGLTGTTSGTVRDSTAVMPQKITATMVKSVGPKEATQAQVNSVVRDVNAAGRAAQRAGDSRAIRAFNKLESIKIDSSDWSVATYQGTKLPYSALAYASFESKRDRGTIVLNAERFFGNNFEDYRVSRIVHEILHFDTDFDNQKVREMSAGCQGWNCRFESDVDQAAKRIMDRSRRN
ncbi:RHS repeat-associated core domain-containing protein [Lysobacter sp. 5GHs7-4]|nr:RHS repeat-associated core domain-containing protein [Lysobacter sp. 5GHs7-4]UHQ25284.1 RHS repeat-associated core domain-containing protein [Lysobacter sp. 5GHs7-4]